MVELIQKTITKHWPSTTNTTVELLVDHLLLLIVAKIQVGWAAHGTQALCKLRKVRIGTSSTVVLNFWFFAWRLAPKSENIGWLETRPVHILSWWFIILSTASCNEKKGSLLWLYHKLLPQKSIKIQFPLHTSPSLDGPSVSTSFVSATFAWRSSGSPYLMVGYPRIPTWRKSLFAWVENYQGILPTHIFSMNILATVSVRDVTKTEKTRCLEMGQSLELQAAFEIHWLQGFTSKWTINITLKGFPSKPPKSLTVAKIITK